MRRRDPDPSPKRQRGNQSSTRQQRYQNPTRKRDRRTGGRGIPRLRVGFRSKPCNRRATRTAHPPQSCDDSVQSGEAELARRRRVCAAHARAAAGRRSDWKVGRDPPGARTIPLRRPRRARHPRARRPSPAQAKAAALAHRLSTHGAGRTGRSGQTAQPRRRRRMPARAAAVSRRRPSGRGRIRRVGLPVRLRLAPDSVRLQAPAPDQLAGRTKSTASTSVLTAMPVSVRPRSPAGVIDKTRFVSGSLARRDQLDRIKPHVAICVGEGQAGGRDGKQVTYDGLDYRETPWPRNELRRVGSRHGGLDDGPERPRSGGPDP